MPTAIEQPAGVRDVAGISLASIELAICDKVTTAASPEQCAEVICMVDAARERLKELQQHLEAALTEHVRANGDLTIGMVRYYIGTEKKTKCRDVEAGIEDAD